MCAGVNRTWVKLSNAGNGKTKCEWDGRIPVDSCRMCCAYHIWLVTEPSIITLMLTSVDDQTINVASRIVSQQTVHFKTIWLWSI